MNKNVANPSSFHLARACLAAAALFLVGIAQSLAQGTAFTYQGYLESGSAPADGNFDFRFTLKSAATGGSTIGSARTVINHGVTSGVFTQDLDFGDRAFDGSERYLEIEVRPNGGGAYTTLSPRQRIGATPWASGLSTWSTAEFRNGADQDPATANPIAQMALGYASNGGYKHWIVSRHNSGSTNNAIDFYTNSSSASGGSSRPGTGNRHNLTLADGNVGIGTKEPDSRLHVIGNSKFDGRAQFTSSGFFGEDSGAPPSSFGKVVRVFFEDSQGGGQIYAYNYASGTAEDLILQSAGGNVGINEDIPTYGKLEVTGGASRTVTNFGFYERTNYGTEFPSFTYTMGIWASNAIAGSHLVAHSDARIKNVIGASDSALDLDILNKIRITDYTHIDKIGQGDVPQKKVIAQQVEKVFPNAVGKSKGRVPDIYKMAKTSGGWVELETDLKVGERVRLIAEEKESSFDVLEVRDGAFRTEFKPLGDKVFVYGREVDDFRTVDYDAIAMLNVSATQEIYRQLQAKEKTISDLEKRVAELEAKDRARDAKLAAIEKMLEAQGDVVSFQSAAATKEGGAK